MEKEIAKIERYNAISNQHPSAIIYQMMFVVLVSGLSYRYIFSPWLNIPADMEKDISTLFLIVPIILFGIFYTYKERKSQKEREKFTFEEVNIYEFLKKFESDPVKLEVAYNIIAGKMLANLNQKQIIKEDDMQTFKDKMNNKELIYKSVEILKLFKNI